MEDPETHVKRMISPQSGELWCYEVLVAQADFNALSGGGLRCSLGSWYALTPI
jgi:hypothetical protein